MFGKLFGIKKRTAEPLFGANGRGRIRAWKASSAGPNTAIVYSVEELRRKSRDLTRNYPYMNSAYETISSNIVGPGIRIIPKCDDPELARKIKFLWQEWCEECDLEGVKNLEGLLSLAVRERFEGGEVFIRFVPDNSGIIPLKLQILQAEQCKINENHQDRDGGETIAGIKFDKDGHRKAYIFYKKHPGENIGGGNYMETVEISTAEVCHYFKQLWAGQARGVPEAFSGLLKARDMLEYDEAELQKKKLAAMMAGFVTTPMSESVLNADDEDEYAGAGEAVAEITTGTITTLAPGEDIKFNPPAESGSSYEPFTVQSLRALAATVQLTYEEFTNDMSRTNFSSSRMGLNITQRKHRQEQQRLIHQVLRPIWQKFIESAVLSHALDIDPKEYLKDKHKFNSAKFQPAGWAYVNPQQEVAALKEKVLCGFASRSQIISEMGGDAEEVDNLIALDAEHAASLGLVFTVDPTEGKGAPKTDIKPEAEL